MIWYGGWAGLKTTFSENIANKFKQVFKDTNTRTVRSSKRNENDKSKTIKFHGISMEHFSATLRQTWDDNFCKRLSKNV